MSPINTGFVGPAVATALTVYGIETLKILTSCSVRLFVATALTVYGIETYQKFHLLLKKKERLQQHLPFTVLKQPLSPFMAKNFRVVATALTVYGIETVFLENNIV